MSDASDYQTGQCDICGEDFEICSITTNILDAGMAECECGHIVCLKHLSKNVQNKIAELNGEWDDEDTENNDNNVLDEDTLLFSKFCPCCKKEINKKVTTVREIIENLKKLDPNTEIYDCKYMPAVRGKQFSPFILPKVLDMIEYISPMNKKSQNITKEGYEEDKKFQIERGYLKDEDYKVIREYKEILI